MRSKYAHVDEKQNVVKSYVPDEVPERVKLPCSKLDKNDVMMDPRIFQRARRVLRFKPGADMFASAAHHQLPRYYSAYRDPRSAGKNAFKADWLLEVRPYVNPPWFLIPQCLNKVIKDQAEVMIVVAKWENAH